MIALLLLLFPVLAWGSNVPVTIPCVTGTTLTLTCSGGPPPSTVSVPNVVNQTQAAATSMITGTGLVVGTVGSASSPTIPVGKVISETPSAGTVVAVGSTVNMVVSTGGGSWGGTCAGFATTIVLVENWANPQRMFSGPFGENDIMVVQFTTGSQQSLPNTLIRLAAAEYQGPPTLRTAALSDKPCDLGGLPFAGAFITNQTTVTFNFTIDVSFPPFPGFYPVLKRNTTYYMNLRNVPGQCSGDCSMAVDLVKNGNQ